MTKHTLPLIADAVAKLELAAEALQNEGAIACDNKLRIASNAIAHIREQLRHIIKPKNNLKGIRTMHITHPGPNQTELHMNNGDIVFFSYETPVAAQTIDGWIRTNKYYSATTTKHINRWLDGYEHKIVSQDIIDALVA